MDTKEKKTDENNGWDLIEDAAGEGEICMPSAAEKDKSVKYILTQGMAKDSCSFGQPVRRLGLMGLCFGMEECIFISLLCGIIGWLAITGTAVSLVSRTDGKISVIYTAVFLFSPVIYGLLHVLTVWKDILSGMYERKAVCRFDLAQLISVRCVLFGAVSLLFCLAADLLIWGVSVGTEKEIGLKLLLELSFSSLLLFGGIQACFLWKGRSPCCHVKPAAVWAAVSLILLLSGDSGGRLLMEIPAFCYLLIAAASAAMMAVALDRYRKTGREESTGFISVL